MYCHVICEFVIKLSYPFLSKLSPSAGAAVRYHFLSVAVCLFACLLICRCLYVSNGPSLSICMPMFVATFICQCSVDRRSICLSASVYLYLYAAAYVYLCLFVSVYPFASIYLPFVSVYLSASIIYLSICMRLSIVSICVCLPLSVSIWPGLSVGRSTCSSVGR